MSDRDTESQATGTRFAGDLRRQFETLGERAQEPRKRRRVVVGAVVVGAAVAIMTGGIALAGGFHSDSLPQPLWPAATPGGSPQPGAPATSVYPTNANGQTYGPDLPMVQEPDLILAVATNGKTGYCLRTDLEEPAPKTPEEAARMLPPQAGKDRVIPVYESDGTTQIGVFVIGNGGSSEAAASQSNGGTAGSTAQETSPAPTAQPPDWLLTRMTNLAGSAGDPEASASWALTTAARAVVVEGEDAPATVANPDRAVYVLIAHGNFTTWLWSLPPGVPAPHFSWVFELIDANSHIADGGGASDKPFDTSGLNIQSVILPTPPAQ